MSAIYNSLGTPPDRERPREPRGVGCRRALSRQQYANKGQPKTTRFVQKQRTQAIDVKLRATQRSVTRAKFKFSGAINEGNNRAKLILYDNRLRDSYECAKANDSKRKTNRRGAVVLHARADKNIYFHTGSAR